MDRPNPTLWDDDEPMHGVFVGVPSGELQLLDMPQGVSARTTPRLDPGARPSEELRKRLAILQRMLDEAAATGQIAPRALDLANLSADDLKILSEVLGEGEVSIVAGQDPVFQVHESTLTGVWRVRAENADGLVVVDRLEVGDVPALVREAARLYAGPMPALPNVFQPGVMNAPALVAEIRERAEAWTPGGRNHVVNFTLFPMTEEDNALITAALGRAPLTIVSGGYGTSRVMLTAVGNVWAVQYLNAVGTVILDTIEIGDVPESVVAAAEDFADSARRLTEIVEAYL